MNYKTFVDNLNSLIEGKGITATQLARDIDISPVSMLRYIKNERTPDITCVAAIASYFKVSLDWLLGLDDVSDKETSEFTALFASASSDDRAVISAILDKYRNKE